jgi:hypothetical protein
MTERSKDDQLADMFKANDILTNVVLRMCEANERLLDRLWAAQDEIHRLRMDKIEFAAATEQGPSFGLARMEERNA